jgi:RNA polymerase sigma factor (sigma-70 family)
MLEETAGLTDAALLERYLAGRDQAAFEALLRRHGAMVLGVCRRVLRNEHDAEDAFQATFLVFARKAAAIRPRALVGNWLYGVAHKTALKAHAMKHRRQTKEREAGMVPNQQAVEDVWRQALALLDVELSHLPEKYRAAIVLCDLEGKTIKQAAGTLGCPQGTVAARLTRGRKLLARRLSRHGLALSAGAIATTIAQGVAQARVPAALVLSTLRAASLGATGPAVAAGVISASVAALTEGVIRTMLWTKLKIVASVLLLAVLACYGAASLTFATAPAEPVDPARKSPDTAAPAGGGLHQIVAAAPQGGVPLLLDQDVKIEVRGVLEHWQLRRRDGLMKEIPKHPWIISAKGVTFALDLSASPVLLDLDKQRFHGKRFLVKGTLEGQADGPAVLKVTDMQPVDR